MRRAFVAPWTDSFVTRAVNSHGTATMSATDVAEDATEDAMVDAVMTVDEVANDVVAVDAADDSA